MLAIRLPQPIEDRLAALADKTGRTKTALAREAILKYIEDLEDFYLPKRAQGKIARRFPWKTWSASLAWIVEFDPDAVKDLKKLAQQVQRRILEFLHARLSPMENPCAVGEALAGSELRNYWKYRVGDWRIICDIQDKRIVVRVLRVGNRREVYR